ncbi:Uncharacterised protein [Segatella copri]|nr:Uncharacterised protein [Segatella copri]
MINRQSQLLYPVFHRIVAWTFSEVLTKYFREYLQDLHYSSKATASTHIDKNTKLNYYKRESMSGNRCESNALCSLVIVIF